MPEVLYKKSYETYRTVKHLDHNIIRGDDKVNRGVASVSKIDGYKTDKLYYFSQDTIKTDEETFIENYGNPFAEVINERFTVVVEKEENKVRLSFYIHHKFRKVGKKFFAKSFHRFYITYNTKTNNIYNTRTHKEVGYRAFRTVRSNNFKTLGKFEEYMSYMNYDIVENNFLDIFIKAIDPEHNTLVEKYNFISELTLTFIKLNGIKGPNHMLGLVTNHYPGKRSLKKNGNNIVHSILDCLGIKSKYFIGLMNNYRPEIQYIVTYYKMLGPKYVRTIDKEFFNNESSPYQFFHDIKTRVDKMTIPDAYKILTNEDKKNIVKVINDFTKRNSQYSFDPTLTSHFGMDRNLTGLLEDHIRMIKNIQQFEPNIRFKAKNMDEFNNEHINYTEKYNLYRNSEEVYYLYDDKLIQSLSEKYKGCEYVLLTNDMDYINESAYQSNCVRTYVDKFKSIIISVRKGKERITTEFNYQGQCIQKRGRFNSVIEKDMIEYVDFLEHKMLKLYRDGELNPAKVKIHNKITNSDSYYTLKELMDSNYKLSRGNDYIDDLNDELDLMFLG